MKICSIERPYSNIPAFPVKSRKQGSKVEIMKKGEILEGFIISDR
jgi:hypothetical protein